MDTSFLNPSAVDWVPPSIILDLYTNVNDLAPQKVNLLDFIADEPNPSYKYKKRVMGVSIILSCIK